MVKLYAGFIPRTYARMIMREGLEGVLAEAKQKDYIDSSETCMGSEEHYNYFESMISGRNMHDKAASPTDNFRKMFPAQVIKDASMAHRTVKLLEQEDESSKDKYLLLMGTGHMGYGFGVPERIFAKKPDMVDQSYMITVREPDHMLSLDK